VEFDIQEMPGSSVFEKDSLPKREMSLVFGEVSSSLLLASVFCFVALNMIGFLTFGIVLRIKKFEQVFTFGKAPWLRTLPKVGLLLTPTTHMPFLHKPFFLQRSQPWAIPLVCMTK
jgi:hypothetical protein